ncbi:hypothetical protein TBLA_0D03990 [Henningerozyma blattae CBS 6284]|uniref:Cell division control protein 45 n=1 Tax=Henningerozyma blattae (strain ATCC 34711 / CBS 6284 / DSM 70876 / NBRC 10599 / NRRL Y-10934 / UCD 77-7) TaxID=1071380 RepID=I2H3E4_HENB6|nr:hypothetical protein TBLA_0D03990 [Tetrapisispora blattae CBS 6284]CCH60896.1 hypothetical protein TBLA_0D03990 [Tetrapisispora blattae CBS 6284]
MYYPIQQIGIAYNQILKRSSSHSSCQLVIFVSCLNIDAMCATKILSLLFRKQLIQSQIIPVFGYSELKYHYQNLDEDIISVILVGCGGIIDIETFFEINPDDYLIPNDDEDYTTDNMNISPIETSNKRYKRDIYVFDSHRPWNLDNLFGSDIVRCFDDGTVEEHLNNQKDAYHKLIDLENQQLAENSNNNDDGNGETDTDEDSTSDFDDVTEEDNDDEDDLYTRKRKNKDTSEDNLTDAEMKKKLRKQRKKEIYTHEKIIEKYYSQGTTIVNSICTQVYSLLSVIGETNLQYLWLTILGAASLDASYPQIFNRLSPLLQDEVKRLSPNRSALKTPDTTCISIQPDYYLFLLRHSSLYESFYYSNYVNAKLSIWNENGKKRLHKMFAHMGISLNVAQESWLYMDNSVKRDLGVIFDRNLDRYGLQDIVRDGFVRTFGYCGSMSASEFVEALTALLEVGNGLELDTNKMTVKSGNDTNMANTIDEDNEENKHLKHNNVNSNGNTGRPDDILSKDQKKWISNFWLSWDALDDKKADILNDGIKHAQVLQHAIFNTGVAILDKRLLKNLRIYRLCVLQDGPDLQLYKNPLTLLRLGNWLIECCAESESNQLLPMVLASLDEANDTYLVAGLSPRYPRGLNNIQAKEPILNNFSMAFQQITSQTGAKVKIDNFESSIIEIQKDDLSPFLEKLTLSGLL